MIIYKIIQSRFAQLKTTSFHANSYFELLKKLNENQTNQFCSNNCCLT